NSKSEIRNKSKIPMQKIRNRKPLALAHLTEKFSFLVIRICFEIRISDFEFRIFRSSRHSPSLKSPSSLQFLFNKHLFCPRGLPVMRQIQIGNISETVVERADYPPQRLQAILGKETVAVLGYGVQGRGQS